MTAADETVAHVTTDMPGRAAMAEEPIVDKAYYSIGEVCDLTGLRPHVLRYWETQFSALRPSKNRAGNRVYRPKEVELIHLLKQLLYDRKYTIAGANRKVLEMRRDGELPQARKEAVGQGAADPDLLAGIREELEQLKAVLTVPAESRRR
jgi:DNA-binding transcriptional MerR regulator